MCFELQRGQINQKAHSQRTARPCSSHIHDQQHQPHPPDQATNCVMHLGVLPVPQQKKNRILSIDNPSDFAIFGKNVPRI